jgi:hypothetical protein
MNLAVKKTDPNEVHCFTWTEADELMINNKLVNPIDWEIIEFIPIENKEITP